MSTRHITGYSALSTTFDLSVWSLGFAAWIFTGYSSRSLNTTGKIIRLVDDERIPHGTVEFREAETEKNRIIEVLTRNVGAAVGVELTFKKDKEGNFVPGKVNPLEQFDRNWLIDLVVNHLDDDDRIEVWWVNKAIKDHVLPAYIRPSALSLSMLQSRGYNSFTRPSKPADIIDPPDLIPLKAQLVEGEVKIISKTVAECAGEEIRTLYKRSGVKPKGKFYKLLADRIEDLITEVPERQFEGFPPIEGWGMHCRPRPTEEEILFMALKLKSSKENWDIYENGEGRLYWEEVQVPENMMPEKGNAPRKILANRIEQWFFQTEAGQQYQSYIADIKKSG